jgi:hypothetical protein
VLAIDHRWLGVGVHGWGDGDVVGMSGAARGAWRVAEEVDGESFEFITIIFYLNINISINPI